MKNLHFVSLISILHSAFPHSLRSCTQSAIPSLVPGLAFLEAFPPFHMSWGLCRCPCPPLRPGCCSPLRSTSPGSRARTSTGGSAIRAAPWERSPHDFTVTIAYGLSESHVSPPTCSLHPWLTESLCQYVIQHSCHLTYANMWHMGARLLTREFLSISDFISILGSSLVQLVACCRNSFVHQRSEIHTTLCRMLMMQSFLWIIINIPIYQCPAPDLRGLRTDATECGKYNLRHNQAYLKI